MLKAMKAEGLDFDAAIRVLEAGEKRADPTNAARQARHRARRSNAVTVTPVTPPPNDIYSNPPPELPTKPSGLEPKPKKHRLPDDWEPMPFKSGSMAALVMVRWEPGRLERELAKFRSHYAAAGTKWENWQAVWCKWVNNSDDFQRGNNGGNQQHSNLGRTAQALALNPGWDSDDRPF